MTNCPHAGCTQGDMHRGSCDVAKAQIDPNYHARRKAQPVCTGVLDYFPDALLAVAELSRIGNEQHNPGQPLHWAKEKSTDEPDALVRHLIHRGTLDVDGVRHSAKVAWRALALLQREIDAEKLDQTGGIPSVSYGSTVLDPLAQRPDENAKQHRDRVNVPWPDMRILVDETPSSNSAPAPAPLARQPDDFSETRIEERRPGAVDRRVAPWTAEACVAHGSRRGCNAGRRKGDEKRAASRNAQDKRTSKR